MPVLAAVSGKRLDGGGSKRANRAMDEMRADSPTNAAEYTVSEISGALKRTVEEAYGNVRVRGEISGYRGPHSSGHAYFALKDERARLEAVIWRGTFARLRFRPEEGLEVIASGRLTTFPGSSKYQIVIDSLEPAGAGALMALLEERKRRLAAEGLFEEARKRPLPFLPRVIGVVTSPTGAVIRDIIHRIADRFPLHVLVWPIRVQGETAGQEAAAAVAGFDALAPGGPVPRPDVVIVARGGGSLEDLWGFNDEALARAVAASRIPVISAVGHETDWTLIDLVADRRAPTPTGAAEIAVPVKAELEARLATLVSRLRACTRRNADRRRERLRALARALPAPDQMLALPRQRFDGASARLARALVESTARKRARLGGLRLSVATLERGLMLARRHHEKAAARLLQCHARMLADRRRLLSRAASRLSIDPVARNAAAARRALATVSLRADRALDAAAHRRRARLDQMSRVLGSLDWRSVLQRGYALVKDAEGAPLVRAGSVRPGAVLSIAFADGEVRAIAAGGDGAGPRARAARRGPEDQGTLL